METEDIYIDLLLSNSVHGLSNTYVKAQFVTSQSQPILAKCNNHKLSIIRFTLDTQTLPIFEATMRNATETCYSITMSYNGDAYTKYMEFIPQNLLSTDKYVYTYQFLIYMVNQCLIQCFNGLSCITSLPYATYPAFTFNTDTLKASLNIDSDYYGYNEPDKINIYMNLPMYSLFDTLPAIIINPSGDQAVQLNNNIGDDPNILIQNDSTTAVWSPVQSMAFTNNLVLFILLLLHKFKFTKMVI